MPRKKAIKKRRKWSAAKIVQILKAYDKAPVGAKHLVLTKHDIGLSHIDYWRHHHQGV